jgi:hypothetical protein
VEAANVMGVLSAVMKGLSAIALGR